MENDRHQWVLRICGMAICMTCAYVTVPLSFSSSPLYVGSSALERLLCCLLLVGLLPTVLLFATPGIFRDARYRRPSAITAYLLRFAGCASLFLAPGSREASLALALIGYACIGTGMAFNLTYWGLSFCLGDEKDIEHGFVVTMASIGVIMLCMHFIPLGLYEITLLTLPLIEIALMLVYDHGLGEYGCLPTCAGTPETAPLSNIDSPKSLLLRVWLINAVITFVWTWVCQSNAVSLEISPLVTAAGFMLASLLMQLFVRYSPTVGFAAAARYAVPLLAGGVLFVCIGNVYWAIFGFLLLASAHASFEIYLRLRIVNLAVRQSRLRFRLIVGGNVSIMLGTLTGFILFDLFPHGSEQTGWLMVTGLLVILVVLESMLQDPVVVFKRGDDYESVLEEDKVIAPKMKGVAATLRDATSTSKFDNGIEERKIGMAEKYSLSKRETEVLYYLLEGRSHPFIRDALYISQSTVDTHVRHIYVKVGVNSKQDLIDKSFHMNDI